MQRGSVFVGHLKEYSILYLFWETFLITSDILYKTLPH